VTVTKVENRVTVPPPARILWIIDSMAAEAGTEHQIFQLGSRLDCNLFDVKVATLESSSRDAHVAKSLKLVRFPLGRLWSPAGLLQLLRIAAYICRHRIQVVHGFTFKSSVVAALAGILSRAPVVLTSRRNLGYYYTPRILSIVKRLNNHVTRVVANSEAAKNVAIKHENIQSSKVDVLYNGVDFNRFQAPASDAGSVPLPAGKRLIGAVANYRSIKDLPLFLRAAVIVAREVPDTAFLLIGAGAAQSDLEKLAAKLGIADHVIFTGGKGSVAWYLQHMQVGCLSSVSEGFSNSILEYMAAGLPVVATDVGGNREAVVDGETGYLVTDRDAKSFAAPIIRLLNDETLRLRLGQNGQELCRQRFLLESAVSTLERYYHALIETGAPPLPESADENNAINEQAEIALAR